jgi:hypothetical protein
MLPESAPETLDGSFAPSLNISKLWLCRGLKRVMQQLALQRFNTVYNLGSWYGNMAMFMLLEHIPFRTLIDVDIDEEALAASHAALCHLAPSRRIISLCMDANQLRYQMIQPALVINTSTNNMTNSGWLGGIPRGTLVALQGRSDEPQNRLNTCENLKAFDRQFALKHTLYLGEIALDDPDDHYMRYMKIGLR